MHWVYFCCNKIYPFAANNYEEQTVERYPNRRALHLKTFKDLNLTQQILGPSKKSKSSHLDLCKLWKLNDQQIITFTNREDKTKGNVVGEE